MDTLLRDLRFAVRGLLKTPGFTVAAVLALALGIGATTAIFSVVHAVLVKSLGWGEETRLGSVTTGRNGRVGGGGSLSPPEALDLRDVQIFESSGGFSNGSAALAGERTERVPIAQVTAGFFEALGVRPIYGRDWTREEDMKGKSNVALISNAAWRRRFAGDPSVVGNKSVTLDGETYRLIGILPEGFSYNGQHDFYLPYGFPPEKLASWRGAHWLEGVVRLKPGVSMQAAEKAMADFTARLTAQYPEEYRPESGERFVIEPLRDRFVGSMRQPLFVLFGAVLLVLLIACANVANLLLARSSAREREFAVRAAIGASRSRLIRQLLTEGLVMAVAGMVLGVLLAAWGLDVLLATAPRSIRELTDIHISQAVLVFSIALAGATTVIFALVPALRASKVDVASALKDGSRGSSGAHAVRLRSVLVAGQVAISLFLLAGAGLMLRSFETLLRVSPGFDPDGVASAMLAPAGPVYDDHPEARIRYFQDALHAASTLPGVRSAGGINILPATGGRYGLTYFIEGYTPAPGEEQPVAQIRWALPGTFATLREPMASGREFALSDDAKAPPVAMVNEAWVKRYFPGKDVVGQRIRLDTSKPDRGAWRTIVGVVSDAREFGLDKPTPPIYYFAALQDAPDSMTMVARGSVTPAVLHDALAPLDLTQPLDKVQYVSDILAKSLTPRRFPLQLLGAFAVLALLLSALGIYGVTSYSVSQRTREIGLRMAVGSSSGAIVRLVLGSAMRVVGAGLAVGIVAAIAGGQLIASQLYGVSPHDPITLVIIPAFLAMVALAASGVPAARAARVDPMTALRTE